MEKFCQHIEKLLARHDYVVVPNFGGFVLQTQSAVLHPDRIVPPLASIGFNPLMHHADGLLAIEIARAEGLSYRKAMENIENELALLKQRLSSGGVVQFGNLGTLQYSSAGNILFIPTDCASFLPHNFELIELYVSPKTFADKSSVKRISFVLPSTRVYKLAAAGMLIFGLLGVAPTLNDARRTERADFTSILSLNHIDSVASIAEVDTVDFFEPDSVPVAENIVEEKTPYYHVIVASLATLESAKNYCEKLKDDDFTGAHVLESSHISRIAIQSFANKKQAVQYMENLRRIDSRFQTAWVLCDD